MDVFWVYSVVDYMWLMSVCLSPNVFKSLVLQFSPTLTKLRVLDLRYVMKGSTIAICCWPEHQSLLPTSCSGSWTLHRELWAARRSTTAAWHTCFTLSYIGSTWQIESHTSLGWSTVYKCSHGQASNYLSELCTPDAQVAERQHLRSAKPPSTRCSTVSARYVRPSHFAVAGPTIWNLFQNNLREPVML